MPDRRHANGLVVVGQLEDDPVRPDPQRAQPAKSPAQGVTRQGLLELPESVLDGGDDRPIKVEEVLTRAPREDDARHGSAAVSAFGELSPKVLERHGLAALQLR